MKNCYIDSDDVIDKYVDKTVCDNNEVCTNKEF